MAVVSVILALFVSLSLVETRFQATSLHMRVLNMLVCQMQLDQMPCKDAI